MARGARFFLMALAGIVAMHAARAQVEDEVEEDAAVFEEEDPIDEEAAASVFIAANKAIEFGDVPLLVVGKEFTVTYELFNLGNAPAYGVELMDSWDDASFELVKGEATAAFDRIEGDGSAKHTVVLRPLKEGVFDCTRANITYTTVPEDQADEDAAEYREALTSTDGLVQVVTAAEYRRRTGSTTNEWLVVAALSALVVVGPMLSANTAFKQLEVAAKKAR